LAPRQYVALANQYRLRREREIQDVEWGPALIAATVLNTAVRRAKGVRAVSPLDLMPSVIVKRKAVGPDNSHVPFWMAQAKAITINMGGTIGVSDRS
jgi:hypothetical protein